MSNSSQQPSKAGPPSTIPLVPNHVEYYLVLHAATTCDEHGVYVTKDSAEVIELGWVLVEAKTLEEKYRESVLVKPINTPITPLCTSLTTLTWENVRNAGTFREAIARLDDFIREKLPNIDFVFVTFENWDLRVQLPREARDKSVVLPAYLQHSRLFDLKVEYQHWQVYHPESLPFGASSLSNICAALEVEPLQPSPPIKHNLPFHLQALAPASPRRALEEAITLARVLKGLILKSQPHQEHPDVLMHPFDARADVRSFLAERSKVLYMSGLPHDTTQSELESWFTQYGGRPIAFWTMRTPDQHKPTGSGFAIFSSHEEAAESLCMNGRALNEKAIEVSPSSHHVLDRAGEFITAFPPSKNRPRPGDWTCPSCGFSNFQRRVQCFRCSYPAIGGNAPQQDPNMGFQYGYPHAPPPPMMPHQYGHAHGGPAHHRSGGSAPFRPGDWRCSRQDCLYHNFAKNVSCLRCGSSRAHAVTITEGPSMNLSNQSPQQFNPYAMGPHAPMHHGPPEHATGPDGRPHMGTPGAFPSAHGGPGFPGAFGPPTGYVMPTGGPNAYGPMGPSFTGPEGNTPITSTGFDSRTEAAFSGGGNAASNGAAAGPGASQSQNATGGFNNSRGYDAQADPFSFLAPSLDALSIDENRRNGAVGQGVVGQSSKNQA